MPNTSPKPAPVTQTTQKFHLVLDTMIGPQEWWIRGTFPTLDAALAAKDTHNNALPSRHPRRYSVARETIVQTFEII